MIPRSVSLYGAVCLGQSGGSPSSFVRRPLLFDIGVVEYILVVVSSRQGLPVARVGRCACQWGVSSVLSCLSQQRHFSHLRGGVCRCHHTYCLVFWFIVMSDSTHVAHCFFCCIICASLDLQNEFGEQCFWYGVRNGLKAAHHGNQSASEVCLMTGDRLDII